MRKIKYMLKCLKNLNVKTETQQQFDYDSSDLPF